MARYGILKVSQQIRPELPKDFLPPGHAIIGERPDAERQTDDLLIEGPLMPSANAATPGHVRMICSQDTSTGRRIVTARFEHEPRAEWYLDLGPA